MRITVLHNQTFLDLAIQYTGLVENSFDIAVYNGFSITDSLLPGTEIEIPEEIEKDQDVIGYFSSRNLQPATAVTDQSIIQERRGIGWMRIESTFKVD